MIFIVKSWLICRGITQNEGAKSRVEAMSEIILSLAHSWARCPQWKRIHDRLRTVMCVFCLVNLLLGRVCWGFYCPASLPVSKCQHSGETRQSVCELKCWVTEGNCCFSTPNIDVWRLILHFPPHKCGTGRFSRVSTCCHFSHCPLVFEYNQVRHLFNFLVVFSCLVLFSSFRQRVLYGNTLQCQSLGSVRFLKIFYAHLGLIYLIKNSTNSDIL